MTDYHAHPGVLFRFLETPSFAVPEHHSLSGVSEHHARPAISGVTVGKFCNTFWHSEARSAGVSAYGTTSLPDREDSHQ